MSTYSEESASSLDDCEDLDDIPLSVAPNGRYPHVEPPLISRGAQQGFPRPGTGFNLKLPIPKPDDLSSPVPEGPQRPRSEPTCLPETARTRPPPGLSLSIGVPRAPSTSYNGAGHAEEATPILGRRNSLKPPMLNLVNPASASPVPSGAPTPGFNETGEGPPRLNPWPLPDAATRRAPLRVDLVSSAFVLQGALLHDHRTVVPPSLPAPSGGPSAATASATAAPSAAPSVLSSSSSCLSEYIVQQCSSQLGIAACDLEFLEVRPLEGGLIPESCTRVGVMIRGSAFSLSALEDLLAKSKRDSQLTTLLEGALRESSQHAAEAKQHAEKFAKQNEELVMLKERVRGLEASNQHLREQLQRSDEHRQLLGATIRTIKKEFEDFKSRVVVEGSLLDHLPLHQLNLGPLATAVMGQVGTAGGAPAPAATTARGERAAAPGMGSGGGGGGAAIAVPAAAAAAAPASASGLSSGSSSVSLVGSQGQVQGHQRQQPPTAEATGQLGLGGLVVGTIGAGGGSAVVAATGPRLHDAGGIGRR